MDSPGSTDIFAEELDHLVFADCELSIESRVLGLALLPFEKQIHGSVHVAMSYTVVYFGWELFQPEQVFLV